MANEENIRVNYFKNLETKRNEITELHKEQYKLDNELNDLKT